MFCRKFLNIAALNINRSHDAAEARLSVFVQANRCSHLDLSHLHVRMLQEFCCLLMDKKKHTEFSHHMTNDWHVPGLARQLSS